MGVGQCEHELAAGGPHTAAGQVSQRALIQTRTLPPLPLFVYPPHVYPGRRHLFDPTTHPLASPRFARYAKLIELEAGLAFMRKQSDLEVAEAERRRLAVREAEASRRADAAAEELERSQQQPPDWARVTAQICGDLDAALDSFNRRKAAFDEEDRRVEAEGRGGEAEEQARGPPLRYLPLLPSRSSPPSHSSPPPASLLVIFSGRRAASLDPAQAGLRRAGISRCG